MYHCNIHAPGFGGDNVLYLLRHHSGFTLLLTIHQTKMNRRRDEYNHLPTSSSLSLHDSFRKCMLRCGTNAPLFS